MFNEGIYKIKRRVSNILCSMEEMQIVKFGRNLPQTLEQTRQSHVHGDPWIVESSIGLEQCLEYLETSP